MRCVPSLVLGHASAAQGHSSPCAGACMQCEEEARRGSVPGLRAHPWLAAARAPARSLPAVYPAQAPVHAGAPVQAGGGVRLGQKGQRQGHTTCNGSDRVRVRVRVLQSRAGKGRIAWGAAHEGRLRAREVPPAAMGRLKLPRPPPPLPCTLPQTRYAPLAQRLPEYITITIRMYVCVYTDVLRVYVLQRAI